MPPRDGRDVEQPLRDRESRINSTRNGRGPAGRFRRRNNSTTVSQAARNTTNNGGTQGRQPRLLPTGPNRRFAVNRQGTNIGGNTSGVLRPRRRS